MGINPALSASLRVLSFVAALFVVAIHSNSIHYAVNPAGWSVSFHRLFCNVLSSWAVPYFFFASGFFFSLSGFVRDGNVKSFFAKKATGLVVPYVLWTVFAAVVTTPAVIAANCMAGRPVVANSIFQCSGIVDFFVSMFALCGWGGPKILGVLWFVKHLIVVFAFAPVLRIAVNKMFGWVFLIAFVAARWYFPPFSQTAFFFLGVAVAVYLPRRWLQGSGTPLVLSHVLNYAFWLYCSHNLVICYAGPATRALFGTGSIAIVAATTVSWTCSVAVGLGSAYFVERRFPRVFAVMNGGR